jgi:site-specific recombinase XerD
MIGAKTSTNLEQLVKESFLFGCFTGLRFSDMCLLTKDDIIREGKDVKLSFRIAKTDEPFVLPLPRPAIVLVNKWKKQSKTDNLLPILSGENTDDALKKEISSRNAYFNKVIKSIATRAGLKKNVSFHLSRHTFATNMLSSGAPIEVVSKLLGHEDIKTTQIYARIVDETKDQAMRNFEGLIKRRK